MRHIMKFVCALLFVPAIASAATEIVPKVFFPFWNDGRVVTQNNCYNYSTNRRTDSYAQPGQASGQMYKDLTCKSVYEAAGKDLGMEPTPFFPFKGKGDDALVALVVWPGGDYHWYRRGDDNMWTHKMGGTPATNLDSSGKVITNPETADRGRYVDFCGYFRVKNYLAEADEQNGGFVRIGNMPNLPPLPTVMLEKTRSTVRALVYSGRPDPVIPMTDVINELSLVARADQTGGTPLKALPAQFNKLGYRGLLIEDREGLLFPAGTVAQVRGDDIFVFNRSGVVWKRISGLAGVESRIARKIAGR